MKKVIFLSASIFLVGAASLTAQTVSKSKGIHFGMRVGANLSNVIKDGDSEFKTGSKLGGNAAVFVDIPVASVFSIQPEIQYSQKGYKNTGSFLGSPYEYKQTTSFFEVPLLAKIKPTANFGILVGPQFSFLSSTKTNFTVSNSSYETVVKEDNDNLRKNILGGVIGVEAMASNFVVGLRYNIDFQNNNGDGSTSTPRYKNQVVALSVGVVF
jgi:hypothetical protein